MVHLVISRDSCDMASQPPSNVVNPLPDSKRARMGPGPGERYGPQQGPQSQYPMATTAAPTPVQPPTSHLASMQSGHPNSAAHTPTTASSHGPVSTTVASSTSILASNPPPNVDVRNMTRTVQPTSSLQSTMTHTNPLDAVSQASNSTIPQPTPVSDTGGGTTASPGQFQAARPPQGVSFNPQSLGVSPQISGGREGDLSSQAEQIPNGETRDLLKVRTYVCQYAYHYKYILYLYIYNSM